MQQVFNQSMENPLSSTAADNDNADYEEAATNTSKEKQDNSTKAEDSKVNMYDDDENDNDDGAEQGDSAAAGSSGADAAENIESTSVFVSGLDESATPSDLQSHFKSCGEIERITILVDKHTGKSKGHAYVEFKDASAVEGALQFDGSTLGQKVC